MTTECGHRDTLIGVAAATGDVTTRVSVIMGLRDAAQRERRAQIDQVAAIAEAIRLWSWRDNFLDVMDEIEGGAPGSTYGEGMWRPGADGTPEVAEFLKLEIGPALGISPESAAHLIADVADLAYRHPQLWQHVLAGRVQVWVARKVASLTSRAHLPLETAHELDHRLARFAPGWTPTRILNQTRNLIVHLDPTRAEERRRAALASRYVAIVAPVSADPGGGTMSVYAQLDGEPAAVLDQTLDALADVLAVVHPDDAHSTLRARALELLADPALVIQLLQGDLTHLPATDGRELSLVVHVNPADLMTGAGGTCSVVGPIVRSQLDTLLAGASVTVKPVLDPWAVTVSESYTPSAAMTDRVKHRNPNVAFPYSNRSSDSRGVDLDHTAAWPEGPTTEPNLAPLDRCSHRAKTHAGFRLEQKVPGILHWHTPTGQQFWVTPHGTFAHDPGVAYYPQRLQQRVLSAPRPDVLAAAADEPPPF